MEDEPEASSPCTWSAIPVDNLEAIEARVSRPDGQAVRDACRGRWLEIFAHIGGGRLADAISSCGSSRHHECPVHGGNNGDAFRLFADAKQTGGGVCNSCGTFANGFALLSWLNAHPFGRVFEEIRDYLFPPNHRQRWPTNASAATTKRGSKSKTEPADQADVQTRQQRLRNLWCAGAENHPRLWSYLQSRGLMLDPPRSLRFLAECSYNDAKGQWVDDFPAMIAEVVHPLHGLMAIHRTYLDPAGAGKANVDPAKKLTMTAVKGGCSGAAIKLIEVKSDAIEMAVAEGIETALAFHQASGLPVWSTVSAGGLERVEIPPHIKTVWIAADLDPSGVGETAAHELAERLMDEGRTVYVLIPPAPADGSSKADWLEVLVQAGEDVIRHALEAAQPWRRLGAKSVLKESDQPGADGQDGQDAVLEAVDDPHRLARLVIRTQDDGIHLLRRWHSRWHRWSPESKTYQVLEDATITAQATATAKGEFDREAAAKREQFRPKKPDDEPPVARKVTKSLVANIVNAMESIGALEGVANQPAWIGDYPDGWDDPADILATPTGLIHLPSLAEQRSALIPPTPAFFSGPTIGCDYDPSAECSQWLAFLDSIWPNDPEAVAALQQWFGLLLTPDTSQHKMLMLIGPPRCGKGTIGRVLRALHGDRVANPTLSGLDGQFALQPLVGKTVGIISDARLSGRADGIAIVEKLLSITGEDPQDVHRKYLPTLTATRLPIRFILMSNELPNLRDSSSAFLSRVVMLRITESFLGKEDFELMDRLQAELPGILNWSIGGWINLRQSRRLLQPTSAGDLLEELGSLSSPISEFLEDECAVGGGEEFLVDVDVLFRRWRHWCEASGRDHPGTVQTFGKDLRAKLPKVRVIRRRVGTGRVKTYAGIRLRDGQNAINEGQ